MDKKNEQTPTWFVYNELKELDIEKTLTRAPQKLETNLCFFKEVPEWFELGPQDEIQEALNNIDNIPETERKKLSNNDIEIMRKAFKKLLHCQNLASGSTLSLSQKEFMRCLCYWLSLEAMNSVPLTPEDEENLFG